MGTSSPHGRYRNCLYVTVPMEQLVDAVSSMLAGFVLFYSFAKCRRTERFFRWLLYGERQVIRSDTAHMADGGIANVTKPHLVGLLVYLPNDELVGEFTVHCATEEQADAFILAFTTAAEDTSCTLEVEEVRE